MSIYRLLTVALIALSSMSAAWSDNPATSTPSGIVGDWTGTLSTLGGNLPLIFHFSLTGGSYSMTMDSPSQGSFNIPGGTVTFNSVNVTVNVPAVHGDFTGKLSADRSTIVGSWSQGSPLPLTLTRSQSSSTPSDPIPPTFLGDWTGIIQADKGPVQVVFHFDKVNDVVQPFADCLQQNIFHLAGSPLQYHAGILKTTFSSLSGTLAGTIDPTAHTFTGTWTQGASQNVTLTHSVPTPAAPVPQELSGKWLGSVTIPSATVRIIFMFGHDSSGVTTVSFSSPDQSGANFPGSVSTMPDSVVKLEFTNIGIIYVGTLSEDKKTLVGNLIQAGQVLPLSLQRTNKEIAPPNRPQNPKPPYPYIIKDVKFDSIAHGIRLAGTLTMPKDPRRAPGIVLIAGSGEQDRDENIFGHKIFAVIADYLTRRGFAVLRYDKRGVGESTGSYKVSTTADFAHDAQGAAEYLRTVPGVDSNRIGLIGHSEGGAVAPIVAVGDPNIKFIVLLAGPGVAGLPLLIRQQELIAEGEGASKEMVARNQKFETAALKIAATTDGGEADRAKVVALFQKDFAGQSSPDQLAATAAPLVETLFSPWYRSFLNYDPRTYLTRVKVPVLALNGSTDRQVEAAQNLPAIREALSVSDKGKFEIVEIPDLNHLFQDSKTGAFSEYSKIEETFSPKALTIMGEWLKRTTEK